MFICMMYAIPKMNFLLTSYMHTYVHTYIRTYVHTYIRTYVHTYIRTYVHTYIRTYIPLLSNLHESLWNNRQQDIHTDNVNHVPCNLLQIGDDSQLSLCLVLQSEYKDTIISVESQIDLKKFPYGKLWKDKTLQTCAYSSRVATKGELLK